MDRLANKAVGSSCGACVRRRLCRIVRRSLSLCLSLQKEKKEAKKKRKQEEAQEESELEGGVSLAGMCCCTPDAPSRDVLLCARRPLAPVCLPFSLMYRSPIPRSRSGDGRLDGLQWFWRLQENLAWVGYGDSLTQSNIISSSIIS